MKRTGLLLAIVFTAALANAQIRFDLGLKGGLNFAHINGHSTVTQDYGSRTGFHLGAYALIKILKIGIQPEIVFSRQGQSFSYSGQPNFNSNFDYVNIPIMIKWYLAAGFNLQAGPQFGFLTSAKGDIIKGSQSSTMVSTGQDIKDFVKASDVTIGFGFGWDLPLGVNITGRYNLGLSDINKYTGQSPPQGTVTSLGTVSAKNQVIQLSIGYRLFKLGK